MAGPVFPDLRGAGASAAGAARLGPPTGRLKAKGPDVGKPFAEFLDEQINKVNDTQIAADTAVAAVATGKSKNLHEMMIALEKADISLRALTKVRNKVIEAYQEVMRMNL